MAPDLNNNLRWLGVVKETYKHQDLSNHNYIHWKPIAAMRPILPSLVPSLWQLLVLNVQQYIPLLNLLGAVST